jgi:tetratricopeptide (TPR) repeat protein
MKTQRRHELETNKLADWISKNADQYKSHVRTFLIVIVGVIAIFFASLIYRSSRANNEGAAWQNFYNALSENRPEAMVQVAKDHDGSKMALWAKQAAADLMLREGMLALFTDRDEANKHLKDAEKNLKEVEAAAGRDATLLERARFALGQAYESMGQLDDAKKYYDLVRKTDPESALGLLSAEKFEELSDPKTAEFYNWFSRQKPKAPQPLPPAGRGILDPANPLQNLPKNSDLPTLENQFPAPPISPLEKLTVPDDEPSDSKKDAAPLEKDAAPLENKESASPAPEKKADEAQPADPKGESPQATDPAPQEPKADDANPDNTP